MIEEQTEPRAGFRTAIVFLMLFALLGAVVLFAYFATFERTLTTIILIRHAEKAVDPGNADPNLSPAGEVRALELVRMLGDAGIGAIFATQYKRTQQTVKPLSDKLGIPITQVDARNSPEVIREIRSRHNGEVVFVSAQQYSPRDYQSARRSTASNYSGNRI